MTECAIPHLAVVLLSVSRLEHAHTHTEDVCVLVTLTPDDRADLSAPRDESGSQPSPQNSLGTSQTISIFTHGAAAAEAILEPASI